MDDYEPMDTSDNSHTAASQDTSTKSKLGGAAAFQDTSTKEEDVSGESLWISFNWIKGQPPQDSKSVKLKLEKVLQSWGNKKGRKPKLDYVVKQITQNDVAEIKINPTPDLSVAKELNGAHLTGKDRDEIEITSVSLTEPKTGPRGDSTLSSPSSLVSQTQHKPLAQSHLSSSTTPWSPTPREDDMGQRKSSNDISVSPSEGATGGSMWSGQSGACAHNEHKLPQVKPDQTSVSVPLSHFWYVQRTHKEEIKSIEKEYGVQIIPELSVKFLGDQNGGDPEQALNKFTDLVQKCLHDPSSFPLKQLDPEGLKATLKTIQEPENKLFLALSSEEVSLFGPRLSQDAIRKSLMRGEDIETNGYAGFKMPVSTWLSEASSVAICKTNNDPLIKKGLTIEEDIWRNMRSQTAAIEEKFGVRFVDTSNGRNEVIVSARNVRPGENASLESHALRAVLHLYQKITITPWSPTPWKDGVGMRKSSNDQSVSPSEGATAGWVWISQSGSSAYNTDMPMKGGASAAEGEDEQCPICLDAFVDKKQLTCKHTFCKRCLDTAEKTSGPTCPVCKKVFGLIKGNQPNGKMLEHKSPTRLPGFENCGCIVIDYQIYGGIQTTEHPNPGQRYGGIHRTAYLPDNKEGNEVLALLRRAFDQKLIFTVGTSRTTGMDNQVTWNDIHHKTCISGGPQSFGYPDPDYLSRVKDELKAKGIE